MRHSPEIFRQRTLRDRGCGLCALYECPLSPSSPQESCVVFYPPPHPLGKSHHIINSYVQITKSVHQCKSLLSLNISISHLNLMLYDCINKCRPVSRQIE